MPLLLLVSVLSLPASAAPAKDKMKSANLPASVGGVKAPKKADKDTVDFVEQVLKTETADLPPEIIPQFMEVEADTLPVDLGMRVKARQLELEALLGTSQTRPPIRRLGKEKLEKCPKREESKEIIPLMRSSGFEQISDDEENHLMQKTNCTECELMEEFSLQIIMVRPEKKGDPWVRYLFLHPNDPLWAMIGQYRQGATAQGTNFFGMGFFGACR